MPKMDSSFEQFFNSNRTDVIHNFPLVKTPDKPEHPAEHGIDFRCCYGQDLFHQGKGAVDRLSCQEQLATKQPNDHSTKYAAADNSNF